jgi:hypothetical protein
MKMFALLSALVFATLFPAGNRRSMSLGACTVLTECGAVHLIGPTKEQAITHLVFFSPSFWGLAFPHLVLGVAKEHRQVEGGAFG